MQVYKYYHNALKVALEGPMEIEYFSKFFVSQFQVIKANALTHFSIHYFKSPLISFLSYGFYYIIMKLIMKMMLFSAPVYPFFETYVIFEHIFIMIRHYFSYMCSIFVAYLLYHIRLIRLSGYIEPNPGAKLRSFRNVPICHSNLSSITSHNFLKGKLLTTYNIIHKFAIICMSESHLNSVSLHLL